MSRPLFAAVALCGGALLVGLQGAGASGTSGTWTAPNAMGTARSFHAAALSGSDVLVTGGRNSSGTLATTEAYSVTGGTWSAKAAMNVARRSHTATTLTEGPCATSSPPAYCNKVLVVGGVPGDPNLPGKSSVELYTSGSPGSWAVFGTGLCNSPSSSCPEPVPGGAGRFNHTATVLEDGTILVAGGDSSTSRLNTASIYKPSDGTWRTDIPPMLFARAEHTATRLADGKVLVAGGVLGSHPGADTAEIYDPVSNKWDLTGPMVDSHQRAAAALLNDGRVLVTGGTSNLDYEPFGGTSTVAELFHPGTKTWTSVASMATGRSRHTATLLPTGKVLVAGGCCLNGGSSRTASAELYTPPPLSDPLGQGSWASTGSMSDERSAHTATELTGALSGHVFVTGGDDDVPTQLSSTALYHP